MLYFLLINFGIHMKGEVCLLINDRRSFLFEEEMASCDRLVKVRLIGGA